MLSSHRFFTLVLGCLLYWGSSIVATADTPFGSDPGENKALKALLERPTISNVRRVHLSPDGARVLFYLDQADIEADKDLGSWMEGSIREEELSDVRALELSRNVRVSWISATKVAYFLPTEEGGLAAGIRMLDVQTDADELVVAESLLGSETSLLGDFEWRADGGAVAFRGSTATDSVVEPGGIAYDEYLARSFDTVSLYVYDLEASVLSRLTSKDYSVGTYDWSPDGGEIAFTYETRPEVSIRSVYMFTDIAVVDVSKKTITPLVTQTGGDNYPSWSPTGDTIAFNSQRKRMVYPYGWGALVDPHSREIRDVAQSRRPHFPSYWARNGTWYVAGEADGFSSKLLRVDVTSGAVTEIKWLGGKPTQLQVDSSFSFADDGSFVFIQSSPSTPPEIFWSALSDDGRSVARPKRLTSFGLSERSNEVYDARVVEWRSPDDAFDLAGILVTPKGISEPLPTVLNLIGGPSQIRADFKDSSWPGAVNAAVAAGYAVFTPTSRGRGGFGDAFSEAIGTGGSGMAKPWRDAKSGIDFLVEAGITDPRRIAVIGHSYGGALAAYGITQNDFAAAVLHEPGALDRTPYIAAARPDTWEAYLSRDFYGLRNRFDDAEQAMIIHESALWHADQINTPVLLQCGRRAQHKACEDFLIALREVEVPAEYFLYDEGHVFLKPLAQYNDAQRTLAWIDYWMKNAADE